jgi:parvulin-like peptidyl-prolyl isomerase
MLKINNEPVEESHIDKAVAGMKPQYYQYMQQRGETPDDTRLREWARESVIEHVLLKQEAATLELPTEPASQDATESKTGPDEGQQKLKMLIESIASKVPSPTEPEVEKIYADNTAQFQTPEQVHAAHIVKHTKNGESDDDAYRDLLNIKAQIDKGTTFESLAAEHSDCSDNAGDLGTFPRGQMVQEFEDVVFKMQPDEVSDVFQSPFGYHIVKLYEKHEAKTASLDEVRNELTEHIHDSRRNEAIRDFVDTLKKKATIEDDDA